MCRSISLFILILPALLAQPVPPGVQQRRVQALEAKLLAPCCYEEPVARHQSEAAIKMRLEIERLVAEGNSERDILAIYSQRYGSRILSDYAPPPNWAHLVPWVLLAAGTVALSFWLRRLVRPRPVPPS